MISYAIIKLIQKNCPYKGCKITAQKNMFFLLILPYQQDFLILVLLSASVKRWFVSCMLDFFQGLKIFLEGFLKKIWTGGSKKYFFLGGCQNKIWDGSTFFSKNWPSRPLLSISRNVCPCVSLFVCLFTFEVLLKHLFAPHLPKPDVKKFQRFGILGGKVMEKTYLRFENFY